MSNAVEAQAAKNAMSILQIFAFFHQENIMAEIFERAAVAPRMEWLSIDMDPNGEFSPRTIQLPNELLQLDKDGKWDYFHFGEGIRVLQSFSLVKQSGSDDVYSVHLCLISGFKTGCPLQKKSQWDKQHVHYCLDQSLLNLPAKTLHFVDH